MASNTDKIMRGASLLGTWAYKPRKAIFCQPFWSTSTKVLIHISSIRFSIHMWQSQVEIEHYSVAYFDHIAAFKAL